MRSTCPSPITRDPPTSFLMERFPSSRTPLYDSGGRISGHSPSTKQSTGVTGTAEGSMPAAASAFLTADTCQSTFVASAEQSRLPTYSRSSRLKKTVAVTNSDQARVAFGVDDKYACRRDDYVIDVASGPTHTTVVQKGESTNSSQSLGQFLFSIEPRSHARVDCGSPLMARASPPITLPSCAFTRASLAARLRSYSRCAEAPAEPESISRVLPSDLHSTQRTVLLASSYRASPPLSNLAPQSTHVPA